MRIFIFHNIATDESGRHPAFHSGYVHGHPLVPVFEYWSWQVEPEDCANEAFRLFNVGHDPEFGSPDSRAVAYRQPGNRSLSKGDVVQVIDESGVSAAVTWLACASAGWEVVPPPAYIVRDASSDVTHALPLSVRVPALLDGGQAASASDTAPRAEPIAARDIRPHDHVVGAGSVRWVMSSLVPGAHVLLPHGGALLTFVNDTQMGVPSGVELMTYRMAPSDEDPCPERDGSGVGCVYRAGHDESLFPHRFGA